MKAILRWLRKYQLWFLWLFPALALAALVTQEQVAQAVLNSPYASAALKQYATSIGGLAKYESSLDTTASNSCCYGILQMSKDNILNTAHMTAAEYQQLDLQSQVNYWAKLTSPLLNTYGVKQLLSAGTFDGRTVDQGLILGCMQVGPGNCKTAVNSGLCSGFRDGNKSTICDFANAVEKNTGLAQQGSGSGSGGNPSTGTGGSTSSGGGGGPATVVSCVRDASGACLPINEAMAQAFEAGAGFSMKAVKNTIYAIMGAGMLLLAIGITKDAWRNYAAGRIEEHTLYRTVFNIAISVLLVLLVMSYS